MVNLEIEWLGGNCPVQAEGKLNGKPFYFRARGEHWSMSVGGDDVVAQPEWYIEQEYPNGEFSAGWMTEDEARAFIDQAAAAYTDSVQIGSAR